MMKWFMAKGLQTLQATPPPPPQLQDLLLESGEE